MIDTNHTSRLNANPCFVSVIVPVYNAEKTVEVLCRRIGDVFRQMKKRYEIVLIDDDSADNSWAIMKKLQSGNSNIKIVRLMRNFGQHNAILCGMRFVLGQYVVTIDDDLQNPPEEIPKLIAKISEGYDVVFGALEEKRDALIKKIGSYYIRHLNTIIFRKPKHIKLSSFRILTRGVVQQLITAVTPDPYLNGMIFSITRNVEHVPVRHEERRFGTSNYTMSKLIKLSFNLVLNYSSLPLKFLSIVGIIISFVSFTGGMLVIFKKLFVGVAVPGWTSVVCLLSFFNGLLLFILSIIGEYLSRIIKGISHAPLFAIREKIIAPPDN